jgi:uncharacterized membrane protein
LKDPHGYAMLKPSSLKNSGVPEILSVFLTLVGVMMLVWYLRFVEAGVPIELLFAGVILLSFGNVLAFVTLKSKSNNVHFIFVLFLTTFILINLYTFRFGSLQGSDVLWEYTTARTTLEQGTWALGRSSVDNYFSSLSVSLVPALLSEITGANLSLIFEVIMRLVAALLPLTIFVTVKEIFRNTKLAGLSALLFCQLYFNFELLPSLMREFMAEIAFVLTILILVRMYRKKSSNLLALTIILFGFLFGLAAYHYTVAYWAIFILLPLFLFETIVPSIPKKILKIIKGSQLLHRRRILPVEYLLLFLVLFCFWTVLTNLGPFLTEIHNEVYLLAGGSQPAGISTGQYEVGWFSGSAVGPVTTAWFLLLPLLAGLGFLYFIFKVPKQTRHLPWVFGTLVMFIAVAIWITPSFHGGSVYLDRVYLTGSIFFTTFSAGLLLKINSKLKKINSKLKVVLVIFLLLNLPINMVLLADQRYVLYQKESNVSPQLELFQDIVREPSLVFSEWLNAHESNELIIQADNPTGYRSLYLLNSQFTIEGTSSTSPSEYNGTGLFFLQYLNIKYGLWQTSDQSDASFSPEVVLNQTSVFYDNGQAMLVSFPSDRGT